MTYGYLAVRGDKAPIFLQGQLTCDVSAVSPGTTCLGAHCNQQGRILFCFLLLNRDGQFYLKLPQVLLAFAKQRLEKFAALSQVILEEVQLDSVCTGLLGSKLEEIQQGWVTIMPETCELFTPHELNYPHFQAVSFKKGCYIGQEIIARMEYLGKLKKHLYYAEVTSVLPPQLGSIIMSEDLTQETGIVADMAALDATHYALLILLQDTTVAKKNYLTLNGEQKLSLTNIYSTI